MVARLLLFEWSLCSLYPLASLPAALLHGWPAPSKSRTWPRAQIAVLGNYALSQNPTPYEAHLFPKGPIFQMTSLEAPDRISLLNPHIQIKGVLVQIFCYHIPFQGVWCFSSLADNNLVRRPSSGM